MIVVRHASAGEREEWHRDDRLRPLDERGRRQAQTLVDALAGYEIRRVLSSPYLRCLQSVEPLAAARGLTVELCDELGETRQETDGVALVRTLAGEPFVACVHGGLAEAAFGAHWGLSKAAALIIGLGPRVLARLDASA